MVDHFTQADQFIEHMKEETKVQSFNEDSLKTFGDGSIRGQEPVSIVHYTRPGSSIKQHTPN